MICSQFSCYGRSCMSSGTNIERRRIVSIKAVLACGIAPLLMVVANGSLWLWVTRNAHVGAMVWVTVAGGILVVAVLSSIYVGITTSGGRAVRILTGAICMAVQGTMILLLCKG